MSKKKREAKKVAKKAVAQAKKTAVIKKKRKKKTIDNWKTKKWFTLVAPKSFEEKEIGETAATNPQDIEGRTVKLSLREMTGKMSQQHTQLIFRVNHVGDKYAKTSVEGHQIQRGYVARQLKRMRSVVETITNVTTKDNQVVRVKILTIAKGKMRIEQEKAVRKNVEEVLIKKAAATNFDTLFQEMVFGKVASEIYKSSKKIYPVSRVEIIKTRLLQKQEPTAVSKPAEA